MKHLPWKGRIGRLRFILSILLILAYWLMMIFYCHKTMIFLFTPILTQHQIGDLVSFLSFMGLFITLFLFICLIIRRNHDRGKSGFGIFWLLVPVVQIHTFLNLCIEKGTLGPNRFDSDSSSNPACVEFKDVVRNDVY